MKLRLFGSICGVSLVALGLVGAAAADIDIWVSDTSGLFTDSMKWSPGMPDSTDDIALFSRGNFKYSVTFPGNAIPQLPADYLSGTTAIGSNTVSFIPSTSLFLGPASFTNTAITMGGSVAIPAILNTSLPNLSTTTATLGFGTSSPATLNVNGGTFRVSGTSGAGDLIVGNGSTALLDVNAGAKMTFTGAQGNAQIGKLAGVTGTVNVSGAGAAWTMSSDNDSAYIAVGEGGTGAMNISDGGQVNDYRSVIADLSGSNGAVAVFGASSTWTNRSELVVGASGPGTLSIFGGGQVFDNFTLVGGSTGSSGTVTVDGTGSKWTQTTDLRLGSQANINGTSAPGTMHITAGGQVATGGEADVGSEGDGTATIDGGGSKWTISGQTFVNGTGSVAITGGGQMVTGDTFVDGPVNVQGTASTWNSTDLLSIGNRSTLNGMGQVNFSVAVGGTANSRLAFLGDRGHAHVTIDGSGSTWNTSEQLYVGFDDIGDFLLSNGAHATTGETQIGVSHTSQGTVAISDANSRWTNTGDVAVGVAGIGKLTVSNGGVAEVDGLLSVGSQGTVEGNSHVAANVRNGGTIAPGLSSSPIATDALATLHLDGDLTQTSAGALDIQLASLSSFDKLAIAGHATLGGTLKASLFGGFSAAIGSSFQILTATNGISGTFTLDFPTLGQLHGPFWTLIYSDSDVVLKLISPIAGDYNGNGIVDAADYTIWRDTLGSMTNLRANGDNTGTSAGVIDQADYNIWKSNFGATAGSGAGAAKSAVPEPASLWSFIIGVFTLYARRCLIVP